MKKISLFLIALIISMLSFSQNESKTTSSTQNISSQFDYSDLPWTQAFDSLHAVLKLRYPYTDWKAIQWDEKYSITKPEIDNAQSNSDSIAFIKSLYEYFFSIPDGHNSFSGIPAYYKSEIAGGTYGFNLTPLDDGTFAVSIIDPESPAYAQGLRTGDIITKRNGINIDEIAALECTNPYFNYATQQGRLFSRGLMMTRAAAGTEVTFTFDDGAEMNLTAYDDNMLLFISGFYNTAPSSENDSLVTYRMMENNIAYLRITQEAAECLTVAEMLQFEDFLTVKKAIQYFNDNDVQKMIVDLRGNLGGNDLQAAVTMGLFYQNPSFYEYITGTYDDDYAIDIMLQTEPLQPLFEGEIAVLVDPNCVSTGEGFAMMFDRLDNAHIVSHWGTNGSFGMVDHDPVLLPLDISISFAQARSLDENQKIQLDSDSLLHGGVQPDIKVPLTRESLIQQWTDGIDVQLEYAISLLSEVHEVDDTSGILIYPNPCQDRFTIRQTRPGNESFRLEIFTIDGRKLLSQQFSSNQAETEIDVSLLKTGIYLWQIKGQNGRRHGKLVVVE